MILPLHLPVMILTSLTFPQQFWNRFWKTWHSFGIGGIASIAWSFFWMRFAGLSYGGGIATWLATWFAPPYKQRRRLARYNSKGYISPSATIDRSNLHLGANIFIGDRVAIVKDRKGGSVEIADRVYLHNDTCIQTGDGGSLKIGSDTHIQPRCQFEAYEAPIQIGSGVQIAPNCVFYSYDCGITPSKILENQPSPTTRGITVEDDVWLGHGAVVLDGVRIGKGAVIGSGSVVDRDLPAGAIAVGVPARAIAMRSNLI